MKKLLLGIVLIISIPSFANESVKEACNKFSSSVTFNDEYLDSRLGSYCEKVTSPYTLKCIQGMRKNFGELNMSTLLSCRLYTNEKSIEALSSFVSNERYISISILNALSAVKSEQEFQCIKDKYGQEEEIQSIEIESCLDTSAFILDMRQIENGERYTLRTERAKAYVRALSRQEFEAEQLAEQEELRLEIENEKRLKNDFQFQFIGDGENLFNKLVRSFIVGVDNLFNE